MKKTIVLFMTFIFVLVLFVLTAVAETVDDMWAWNKALTLVEAETGYSDKQLEKRQIVYENNIWAFSVYISEHAADVDGLIVGQMDRDGNLIKLSGPEKVSLNRQLEEDLKSCFNRENGYKHLKTIHDKWACIFQSLSEDQINSINSRYTEVIRLDIDLPDKNSISYEMAYDAALHHLAQLPGWSKAHAKLFRLSISAYYTPKDIGRPVYFFYFEQHSYFEDDYSTKSAMDKYDAELLKAFGKKAPYQFSIMVDAIDGSLVEPPIIDYPSVQFHYLDFLIRTDEIIVAAKDVI